MAKNSNRQRNARRATSSSRSSRAQRSQQAQQQPRQQSQANEPLVTEVDAVGQPKPADASAGAASERRSRSPERGRSGASARRSTAAQRNKKQQQRTYLFSGLAIVVIVAALLIYLNRPNVNQADGIDYSGVDIALAPAITELGTPPATPSTAPAKGTVLGDPNAPVTLAVYWDFQCPFCNAFHTDTLPQILDDFVRPGDVKIELRDYAFLGRDANGQPQDISDDNNESAQAAEAAMCAGEQDKYMQYADTLFANASGENQGAFNDNRLKEFAKDLGLDEGSFSSCLASGKYEPVIQTMRDQGTALGVNATPMFILDNGNGQPNVITMTTEGYNLLKKQIQASVDSAVAPGN